jgi:type I restriction enzyme S subunit
LLSITADLGRTAVIPEGNPIAYINQHLAILRFKTIDPQFVSYQLATNGGQSQFTRLNKEGVKAGLNFTDVRSIKLIKPPAEQQKKFNEFVESLSIEIQHQSKALAQTDTLFSSLQQRAFKGQL